MFDFSESVRNFFRVFISLFVIIDVIGNIPVFISLTEDVREERRKIFNQAIITSFFLLLFFSILGERVLNFFNVNVYSFAVAGGILLLSISINLITGEYKYEATKRELKELLGVVPLAFPLLVGPGAITTTIISIQKYGVILTVLSVFLVSLLNWVILINSEYLVKLIGRNGSLVISKLMAVFVSAIAIEYIVFGIKNLLRISQS